MTTLVEAVIGSTLELVAKTTLELVTGSTLELVAASTSLMWPPNLELRLVW